jgi:hypothetical protein
MNILNKPIEMITSFNNEGIPTPIRFKYSNEEELNIIIKIDKVIHFEKMKDRINKVCYYIYQCRSFIENISRNYELKYDIDTCKWYLYKI